MAEISCPIVAHLSDRPALITSLRTWSYRELDDAINRVCGHLRMLGVQEGAHIAFIAHPTPACLFLLWALFRLRAIACPISFREPAQKIPQLLTRLQAVLLDAQTIPYDTCFSISTLAPDALATFLFTSGSSGAPKIACHTLDNYLKNAQGVCAPLGLNSSSSWRLSLPLFHVGGISILFRIFLTAGAVALSDTHEITHLSCVPTQLYRLLKQTIPPSLQCILVSGAPIPSSLIAEAKSRNLPVRTSYGMTEMSSIIAYQGKALPFREFTIASDGEILVKGATLFQGYWNAGKCAVDLKEGWFSTRDLGAIAQDGTLEILGRKDRLFISGGENIQPEEIERALCSIPGIQLASVFPHPDPEFGHRPIAFIEDVTGKHTLASIKEALAESLPSFKHPVRILPYSEAPARKLGQS